MYALEVRQHMCTAIIGFPKDRSVESSIEFRMHMFRKRLAPIAFPQINENDWNSIGNDFNNVWSMPNCVGAIDGKHIRIRNVRNAASLYRNYLRYFSIVMMEVCDAQYKFTFVDVGAFGSQNDANVFNMSTFGESLHSGTINLPPNKPIAGKSCPFYFIGYDAFPMLPNLLKPYKPTRNAPLTDQ